MSPRRRKDRHEASGFSRRPDPDSDEDEDYERERRKRSKRAVYFLNRRKMQGGGGYGHSPGLMYFVFLLAERHTVNIRAIGINPVFYYIITILIQCFFFPLEEVHFQLFVAFHWFVNTYFTFMHGVKFQERRKAWNEMKPRESLLSFSYWCLPLLVI